MPTPNGSNRGKARRNECAPACMSFVVKKPRLVEEDQLLAAVWYDEQQSELGDQFLDEVEAVISSLPQNALRHSIRFADVRCVRLKRVVFGFTE